MPEPHISGVTGLHVRTVYQIEKQDNKYMGKRGGGRKKAHGGEKATKIIALIIQILPIV